VGRRVQWSFDGRQYGPWRTVIGVAADTRERGPSRGVVPAIHEVAAQGTAGPALLIRAANPGAAAREAARMIHERDPKRPVTEIRTLEDALGEQIAPSRLNATLFSGFGLLSLAIAAVGVGGVLAFAVRERMREFGIRAALGAGRWRLLGGVLVEGLLLAAAGVVIGAAGAAALARLLDSLLFEVQPADAATFGATAILILGVALAASWLPARRAPAVDPAILLRAD
jgi:putative ABC transport system permease protein